MTLVDKIKQFLIQKRITQRYVIDDRVVTEAEWYANGGLEAEEALEKELAEMEKEFRKGWKA